MKKRDRIFALLTALSLLMGLLAGCGSTAAAATMKLRKTKGTVRVLDDAGKSLETERNLGLYSGYEVGTQNESYAWIDLDEVKLTKLDEDSAVEITKNGGNLELELKSGSLFFNVTEPLEDGESLEIRTSSMLIGIRGTCGWVAVSDGGDTMQVWLLEGRVVCETGRAEAAVSAGETAVMTAAGDIVVTSFDPADIPLFVEVELDSEDPPEEEPDDGPEPDPESEPEPPGQSSALPVQIAHMNSAACIVYIYDGENITEKAVFPLSGGEALSRETYAYDEQGRCFWYSYTTGDDGQDYYEMYFYDEQGRLTRDERYRTGGELLWFAEYSYREDGNLREGVRTYPDGSQATTSRDLTDLQPEMTLTNGYADIQQVQTYKNPGDAVYACQEEFDGQGRLIRREHYLNGQLDSYLTHEYDEQGRRVHSCFYNASGRQLYELQYMYEDD